MPTTSILPLVLGQAVLGRVVEPDGPAPEWLRIDGECWKLVTDPEAVAAAQAAVEARERADTAFALAQYAPRIASRPPVLDDAAGKASGAGWLEYDPATQLLKQMWRWTGELWEPLPMDPVMIPIIQIGSGTAGDLTADRVIVTGDFVARVAQILQLSVENLVVTEGATINELVAISIAGATAEFQQAYIQNLRSNGAVIDEAVIGELAANLITSGLFRTAEAGQRLEIESNGLIMWGVDPDGAEYEMVRLGPSGENLLTIGQSTISEEAVSAPRGEFDELTIAGEDLPSLLAPLPRGRVAQNALVTVTDYSDASLQKRLYVEFEAEPGRQYVATVPPFYLQTLKPAGVSVIYLLQAWSIETGAEVQGEHQRHSTRSSIPDMNLHTVPGATFDLTVYSEPVRVRVSVGTSSAAGEGVRVRAANNHAMRIMVDDVGLPRANSGSFWSYGNLGDGSGGSAPPPPPPTPTRYTRTWSPQGWGGDLSGGDIVQGQYGSYGNRSGSWTMPGDMRAALQGSTIEKLEVYLYASHWYYGAGGTAQIRATDGSAWKAFVGSTITSANWPRNAGRWVPIGSAWFPFFESGTWKGFGVTTSSSSLQYYGRFRTHATRFRATYRR